MSVDSNNPNTAASLAATIRGLATEAHRIINGREVEDREIEALLARIDRTAGMPAVEAHGPIQRWLENLRREVEAAAQPVGPA